MQIRKAKAEELDSILDIYSGAREFMRSTGNVEQWSGNYPGNQDILSDIEQGALYLCCEGEELHGVFYFKVGDDPTYGKIYEGKWLDEGPYGVIHRVAVKTPGRRVAATIFEYCFGISKSLRIDTHRDNAPMRTALSKWGFKYCGIIHLANGHERLAFQRV